MGSDTPVVSSLPSAQLALQLELIPTKVWFKKTVTHLLLYTEANV